LDLVALNYTSMINGFTELAITKLDVLSNLDEIKICTDYVLNGKTIRRFPNDLPSLARVEPQYVTLPGWNKDITGTTDWNELPVEARNYLNFVTDYLDVPAHIISSGPKREQTILPQ